MKAVIALLIAVFAVIANADIALHGPRGSNCRLQGQNRNRDNANRLFDSQNNDRIGYNVGSTRYYDGSISTIEWTAQHSCGNANNHCEFVLQYMCDGKLRDGTTETTIPNAAANCIGGKCDDDPRYGRQESWDSYRYCTKRSRNLGLYVADRLPTNGNNKGTAQFTRQNNAGTRYGYECPEERDYYPYWGPTPWKDVAIFTNEPQRCSAYQAESQNVKARYYCRVYDIAKYIATGGSKTIPITKSQCEALVDVSSPSGTGRAVWTYVPPHNVPAPECRQNTYTRDNHHGNSVGGQMYSYNWTLPSEIHDRCVFRIRYNITSYDYDAFAGNYNVYSAINSESNDDKNKLHLNKRFKFTAATGETDAQFLARVRSRGYWITNNPDVDIFGSLTNSAVKLQLNVNTAQFFRAFEERSHRFAIKSRDGIYPEDAVIYNVGVRGKRGNIVQTYPAVEYDFQPNKLNAAVGEYVHFQWTGSNNNPNNNDGQGRAGSDRNNIVGLVQKVYYDAKEKTHLAIDGAIGSNTPKILTAGMNFLGWDVASLVNLATLASTQYGGDMDELDDAGTYFNLEPKMLGMAGIFNYMCTRNNNFSNRSQKGSIIVDFKKSISGFLDWTGGMLKTAKAVVSVEEGVLTQPQLVGLTVQEPHTLGREGVWRTGGFASDVITLSASMLDEKFAAPMTLRIKHDASPLSDSYVAYARSAESLDVTGWEKLNTDVGRTEATVTTDRPGIYAVREETNILTIILLSFAAVIFVAVLAGLIFYCRRKAVNEHIRLHEELSTN